MKYINVSKKISLTKEASQKDLKQALLERVGRVFTLDNMTEQESGFQFYGTTGTSNIFTKNASVDITVNIVKNQEVVRILVYGHSKIAKNLTLAYAGMFFLLLLLGLLPGSIETSGESSDALDVIVFMLFGVFIFYDMNKKLLEPQELLHLALESLNTEFG
ncbi:MAG: hypothetical protein KAJ86_03070 [Alphaproteobacteria bacterium]|nr:hypothetical protein [Alphaproteobacteria bacterium]